MKVVVKDEVKLKLERKEKEVRQQENKVRLDYLSSLRKDDKFQKYVIDEIIQRNLNLLTDTRLIEKSGANLSNKEEIGNLVLISIMSRKNLEKILQELLGL